MAMKKLLSVFAASIAMFSATIVNATGNASDILQDECSQCHNLTGPSPTTLKAMWERKGPDLFYAGNKYQKAWLIEWLQNPEQIRPAGMFYANHIRPGEKRDMVDSSTLTEHPRLDSKTASSIADLLMAMKAKSELIIKGDYKEGNISMSMGEMMFDKFKGCIACHQIEPDYGGLSGPEVYTVAKRLQADYLISYMRNPQAWDTKSFMPRKRLKDRDLQKFVHYFRGLSKENFE